MKRNLTAVLFSLVSLLTASCSKVVFSNGEPITETRSIEGRFTAITMYNNVNVRLVHSDRPHLELTCPKNLIGNIVTELSATGDTLVIKNENAFNWIRSYDYSIDLTVYYDSLREINYASTGDLVCTDSIRGVSLPTTDTTGNGIETLWMHSFYLNIHEGSGDIDLTLSCETLKNDFKNGTSKLTLRGQVGYAEHYLRSYGVIHAETIASNIVSVCNYSVNDLYVRTRSLLIARTYNNGNVYYKGDPTVRMEIHGEGQVIKLP